MKRHIASTLLGAMLLTIVPVPTVPIANAQVSFGIRIGPPPAPRVRRALPRRPGPDYMWIDGYWYPSGRRYVWHDGYWTLRPFPGARWIAPHHDGNMFYDGYWDGDRQRINHDHRWDRDRDRDFNRNDRNRR